MKLILAPLNTTLIVKKIELNDKLTERLSSMGLTKGVKVTIIRKGIFGSPLELKIKSFYLALRDTEAENITVEIYE